MASRWALIVGLSVALIGVGSYVEQRIDFAHANVHVSMLDPRAVNLKPAPIQAGWILDGQPNAAAAQIDQTSDGSTRLIVWRVSAGRFNWFYDFDETITILDGEVFLTEGANAAPGNATERRLGPGDIIFFHNGSTATWRVPDHVRKIATVRRPLPGLIGTLYRLAKRARNWAIPEEAIADTL